MRRIFGKVCYFCIRKDETAAVDGAEWLTEKFIKGESYLLWPYWQWLQ